MFSTIDLSLQLSTGAIAFLICVVAYPLYIRWLKNKQVEQFIREEGPQSHAAKARTPTMGGLCFIAGASLAAFIALLQVPPEVLGVERRAYLFIPLAVGIACGAIGLADDYGKVTSKSNRGLSAKFRLLVELFIGLLLGASLYLLPGISVVPEAPHNRYGQISVQADRPYAADIVKGIKIRENELLQQQPVQDRFRLPSDSLWSWAYFLLLCPLVVAGASNAVNLHDGMDGLAGGTSAMVFATLSYMLWLIDRTGLACIAAAVSGALLAFLCYNRYKAKVFMGDTGSLFLGGLMAALCFTSGLTFWLIPLGMIYIVEAVSVMAQVVVFKLTKPYTGEPLPPLKLLVLKLTKRLPGEGKRLLRMAPIHHHFEAVHAEKGVKEWEVVLWFWLCQLGLCAVTLMLFKR